MRKSLLFPFMFYALAFSATVNQTDWSGGAGVAGPVTNWGVLYSSSNHLSTSDAELKLVNSILPTPMKKKLLESGLDGVISVNTADFDGDGDMDVLVGAMRANTVAWLENTDGTGTKWERHDIVTDLTGVLTVLPADIDGDGDMDAIGCALTDDEISWYENTDGSGKEWTEHSIVKNYDGAWSIHAVDVNKDGKMDVVGFAVNTDDLSWFENTDSSGTAWNKHVVDAAFASGRCVTSADIDNDGNTDLVGASFGNGQIQWWRNTDGTGTKWEPNIIEEPFPNASWVCTGDVDNDGDMDLFGLASGNSTVSWCENTDGSGTSWTTHIIDDNSPSSAHAHVIDIDNDGDLDFLVLLKRTIQIETSRVVCWENLDGSGSTWDRHVISQNIEHLSWLAVADLTGNNLLDVLGAAYKENCVYWWKCIGFNSGVLESSILDAGPVAAWDQFNSSIQAPNKTFVSFQFRSSSDVANMGAWSEIVSSSTGSLAGILADSTRYIQYRVLLKSKKPLVTPALEDISFTYNYPTGIEEQEASWALLPVANPSCNGCFSVNISVPKAGTAELALYDVSGRIINRTSQSLTEGNHSINFNNLSEGVYFCVMGADGYSVTKKIVILK